MDFIARLPEQPLRWQLPIDDNQSFPRDFFPQGPHPELIDKPLTELTLGQYGIVKASAVVEDEKIGHSVFGVSVGKIRKSGGLQKFSANLQDYSDVMSWDVIVSPEAGEAVVISHFQSSDGDDLPHVSAVNLQCK